MARCTNEVLLRKITKKPVDQATTEVSFMLYGHLPDCRRINTKDLISSTDTAYSYNRFQKPVNRFECFSDACVNTGVLTFSAANKEAVYRTRENALDFASGVITLYVQAANADLPVTVTLTIADDSAFANADVYTYSVTALLDDGFAPVIIDLSKTPSSVVGNGWTASESGAYIKVGVNKAVGISSIGIFDSMNDFAINDVVKVGCLTNVGGTYDVAALERACSDTLYDTSNISSFTQTITGSRVTPNYWKLNPLNRKGEAADGFELVTDKFTVVEDGDYGSITVADIAEDECGGITIQLADYCNVTDGTLEQLSIPVPVPISENQFLVAYGDTTKIYFNSALIGQDVLVCYPKAVKVEEYVGNADHLNTVLARMSYPVIIEDGNTTIKEIHIFNKVLITSFPATITNSDTEFSFTITVTKDTDGNFYHVQRVVG